MKTWIIYFVRMALTITLIYFSYLETGLFTLVCFSLMGAGFEALAFHLHTVYKKISYLERAIRNMHYPPEVYNFKKARIVDVDYKGG